jgi:tetratricopeptide (TPR) repeat protein
MAFPRRTLGKALCVVAVCCLAVVGCTSRPVDQPPHLDNTPEARWAYGAYLLSRGEAANARSYLEPLVAGGVTNQSLLLRDVAEARLFSGDLEGAASAAHEASTSLAQRPTTAQFRAADRFLFERTLQALEAAATGDASALTQLATGDERSADAWYLLGWTREREGDLADAQNAYRAFLARTPQWSFLRETFEMRRHAQAVIS